MPDSGGGCCRCCCNFISTLGLTALFMWLSLRTSKPKCYIHQFYIPALNQTLNSPSNTTLFLNLKLENTNKDKGVYYDPINVTVFDSPNRTHLLANLTVSDFYQGHKKRAFKSSQVNVTALDRRSVLRAVSNGSAVFRVDMATSVRYKIIFWKTKRHNIMVGGSVNFSDQGNQVNPKKDIRLSSAPPQIGSSYGKFEVFVNQFLAFSFVSFILSC